MAKTSATAARVIESNLRKAECLKLRQQKKTYVEIGLALGISKVAAFNHVKIAIKEQVEKYQEAADVLRTMELNNLDKYQESLEKEFLTVVSLKEKVKIIDCIRRIMIDRSQYYPNLKYKDAEIQDNKSLITNLELKDLENMTAEELSKVYTDATE